MIYVTTRSPDCIATFCCARHRFGMVGYRYYPELATRGVSLCKGLATSRTSPWITKSADGFTNCRPITIEAGYLARLLHTTHKRASDSSPNVHALKADYLACTVLPSRQVLCCGNSKHLVGPLPGSMVYPRWICARRSLLFVSSASMSVDSLFGVFVRPRWICAPFVIVRLFASSPLFVASSSFGPTPRVDRPHSNINFVSQLFVTRAPWLLRPPCVSAKSRRYLWCLYSRRELPSSQCLKRRAPLCVSAKPQPVSLTALHALFESQQSQLTFGFRGVSCRGLGVSSSSAKSCDGLTINRTARLGVLRPAPATALVIAGCDGSYAVHGRRNGLWFPRRAWSEPIVQ